MRTFQEIKNDKILKIHNIPTYQLIDECLQEDGKRVGLVQATGTGKSFVAIQMLKDKCFSGDKKALLLTSSKPIIEQFKGDLTELGLASKSNLGKLDCVIYPSLLAVGDDELKALSYDYIILDEFHRIGAEKWGEKVNKLLENNPQAKVLGLSATPIRYLDNGRDMAKELFGGNVIEGVNLREAVEQGILPKAQYVIGAFSYAENLDEISKKIEKIKDPSKKEKLLNWTKKAKRRIEDSFGLEDVFAENIDNKAGKFVAFCSDVEQMKQMKEKIEQGLFSKVNQEVKIYEISYKNTSKKVNETIKEFENDNSAAFKIMLSVDMFDEGLHIDGIDGCVMFRPTISPRIYLQQLGRALSVGSEKKPVIFDIVNNVHSLSTIGEVFVQDEERGEKPYTLEEFFPFQIKSKSLEMSKLLLRLDELATYYSTSTEQYLYCASEYAKKHGNLDMSKRYVDKENDVSLGYWLQKIRVRYNRDKASVDEKIVERILELDSHVFEYTLENDRKKKEEKILRCARKFFAENKHLAVQDGERGNVIDPLTGEEFALGLELRKVRQFKKGQYGLYFNLALVEELEKMDPRVFEDGYSLNFKREQKEEKILHFSKIYFQNNGNLAVQRNQTALVKDDETGEVFDLDYEFTKIKQGLKNKNYSGKSYGQWLVDELQKIDPRVFEERYSMNLAREEKESKILRCAEVFFINNGHLAVVTKGKNVTKVIDPKTKEEFNFGNEIKTIRGYLKGTSSSIYSDNLISSLQKIDPRVFEDNYSVNLAREQKEAKIIRCAKIYFDKHKNLAVPVADEGVIIDPETKKEFDLGSEIFYIRRFVKGSTSYIYNDSLINALKEIDPRIFEDKYNENLAREKREEKILRCAKIYFDSNRNLAVPTGKYGIVEDFESGEKVDLGSILSEIRQAYKGVKGRTFYTADLYKKLEEIDPRVFESGYRRNLIRENKGKGE